jgi:transcriptional regulator
MSAMYVPDHFKPAVDAVRDLLRNHGAVDLITATPAGLMATMLPMIFVEGQDGQPDRLLGHVARKNDQWREPALGEAMAIIRGPDAYLTPAWYATKRGHGRVVPTWNYITAHVHGELLVHDDPAWLEANVRQLTEKHEAARDDPWSVDDAPEKYVAGQLRAIVGVELVVSRIEAKFKLSQNRSVEDVAGVIAGLADQGRADISESVRTAAQDQRR